jgi:nucleoid DNA-binding protein
VLACGGPTDWIAPWGELLSTAARARGAEGCVTDGLVRDVARIRAMRFPVFHGGIGPLDTKGRAEMQEKDVPIEIAGVRVSPGDWVMGDVDGVVFVPADKAPAVFRNAPGTRGRRLAARGLCTARRVVAGLFGESPRGAGATRTARLIPLQRRGDSAGAVTSPERCGTSGCVAGGRVINLIERGDSMSKAFIAQVLQESAELTGAASNRAAGDLMDAIVKELKKEGKFTLPSFGTFTVRKTKARKGLNPRTGESIKVKAGKTVRFKASPTLKKTV